MTLPRTIGLAAALALSATAAIAHDDPPKADGHAPAGVMFDHMHQAGSFMLGYRYSWSGQSGDFLSGTSVVNDTPILHQACQNPTVAGHEHCMMKPSKMTMQMHMLDFMYAPTNWLTLMVMPQYMTMNMSMVPVPDPGGTHMMDPMDAHSHSVDGFGDTLMGGLFKISSGPGFHLHAGLMVSAPTGSVGEKTAGGQLSHYMMQLGSGTWDLVPSLTYTGRADRWSWGLQVSGVKRLENENGSGYRLGDVVQTTAWGSYRFADWISGSVRLVNTHQGAIDGYAATSGMSPPDLPTNYGGRFYDIGFGVNTVIPGGALAGHRLSAEWLQPLRDDVNGYQQKRDGTLTLNWSKAF